jgi:intracellular septation protein A
VRLFLALLLFFFFFPRRLNVTCAGGERKKVYLCATNSLLVATAQFLDTLALRYTRILIERISFVVLVVVTEERTEALNYSSTQSRIQLQEQKGVFGGKKVYL